MEDINEAEDKEEVVVLGDAGCAVMRAVAGFLGCGFYCCHGEEDGGHVPPRGHQPTQPHTLRDPGPAKLRRRRPQPRASLPNRSRPDRLAGPPGHCRVPPATHPQPTA